MSLALELSKSEWCSTSGRKIQETVIFPSKNAKMTNIQRFTVSIQSMVKPSVFYPASRTQPNSSLKVSELTSTPPMSWWTAMFLTEKTEENGHLERFYGNVCLRKVLQNDLICYPGYKETPSGHSSVVIDHDPTFLMDFRVIHILILHTFICCNKVDIKSYSVPLMAILIFWIQMLWK